MRSDIEVRDPGGELVLVVELKARQGKDAAWAASIRRNLAAHGGRDAPFFLLVTPEHSYWWVRRGQPGDPEEVMSTRELLGNSLWHFSETDRPSERALQHLVAAWLTRLTLSTNEQDLPGRFRHLVKRTGLLKAIAGGTVFVEPS